MASPLIPEKMREYFDLLAADTSRAIRNQVISAGQLSDGDKLKNGLRDAMKVLFPGRKQAARLGRSVAEINSLVTRSSGVLVIPDMALVPMARTVEDPDAPENWPLPLPPCCAWLQMLEILDLKHARVAVSPNDVKLEARLWLHGMQQAHPVTFEATRRRESEATPSPRFLALYPAALRPDWKGEVRVRVAADEGAWSGYSFADPPAVRGTERAVWADAVLDHAFPETETLRGTIQEWPFNKLLASGGGMPASIPYPIDLSGAWPVTWPAWFCADWRAAPGAAASRFVFHLPRLWAAAQPRWQQEAHEQGRQVPPGAPVWENERPCRDEALAIDLGTAASCFAPQAAGVASQLPVASDLFNPKNSAAPTSTAGGGVKRLPSGWATLAGNAADAWRLGCGERLRVDDEGYLPTRLAFGTSERARKFLSLAAQRRVPRPEAADRTRGNVPFGPASPWLPQAPPPGQKDRPSATGTSVARFKSLQLFVEAHGPFADRDSEINAATACLAEYGRCLGEALAVAYARPREDKGRYWNPLLDRLKLSLTAPTQPWVSTFAPDQPISYQSVLLREAAPLMQKALQAVWKTVEIEDRVRLETEVVARRRRPERVPGSCESPIYVLADMGGQTLHIDTFVERHSRHPGHEPEFPGYSMEYRLGGLYFTDALACIGTSDVRAAQSLHRREAYQDRRQLILRLIEEGGRFDGPFLGAKQAQALREVFARRTMKLIERQIRATLRVADISGIYRYEPIVMHAVGRGWLLAGLDQEKKKRASHVAGELQRLLKAAFTESGRETNRVSVTLLQKMEVCRAAAELAVSREAASSLPFAAAGFLGVSLRDAAQDEYQWCAFEDTKDTSAARLLKDEWATSFVGGDWSRWSGRRLGHESWQLELNCRGGFVLDQFEHSRQASPLRRFIDDGSASLIASDLCGAGLHEHEGAPE